MKKILTIIVSLIVFQGKTQIYDTSFVRHKTESFQEESFDAIYLNRTSKKIKAKYLAYKLNNISVVDRYKEFSKAKDIILYTTGAFMDYSFDAKTARTKGLTVDNGIIVNGNLAKNKVSSKHEMDALVIVYSHGGIAVSNLKERNLKLSGGNTNPNKLYNLRGSRADLYQFQEWAKSQRATVFQTHLL